MTGGTTNQKPMTDGKIVSVGAQIILRKNCYACSHRPTCQTFAIRGGASIIPELLIHEVSDIDGERLLDPAGGYLVPWDGDYWRASYFPGVWEIVGIEPAVNSTNVFQFMNLDPLAQAAVALLALAIGEID